LQKSSKNEVEKVTTSQKETAKKPILGEIVNSQSKLRKSVKPESLKIKKIDVEESPINQQNENNTPYSAISKANSQSTKSQSSPTENISLSTLLNSTQNSTVYKFDKTSSTLTSTKQTNVIIGNLDPPYEISNQEDLAGLSRDEDDIPVEDDVAEEEDDMEEQKEEEQEQGQEQEQDQEELSAFEEIEKIINDFPNSKTYIEDRLEDIIYLILVQGTSDDQSELSLSVLSKLIELPLNFGIYVDQMISGLVALYHSPEKDKDFIDDVMNKIFELGYSDLCLKSLIDNLGKEEHPIVQILIKHISGIYNKNVTDKTEALLPSLMEKFKELFSHSNPEMRKSVVFLPG